MNRPIYIGETGGNTDQWVETYRKLMEANDIGWHFWPYKKLDNKSGFMSFDRPEHWQLLIDYSETSRGSFGEIREKRPPNDSARKALKGLLENMKYQRCTQQQEYINALGLKP